MKTLAGFSNWRGGTLLIGVNDFGIAVGLAARYRTIGKMVRDGFGLHLGNLIAEKVGEAKSSYLTVTFRNIDGKGICRVTAGPSGDPIYVKDCRGKENVLYLRTGNGTGPLPVDEAVKYLQRCC